MIELDIDGQKLAEAIMPSLVEAIQNTLFDYDSLDSDKRARLQGLDARFDVVLKRTGKEIGEIILEAESFLSPEEAKAWVKSKGLSRTTIWRCKQLANGRVFQNETTTTDQPVEPVEEVEECVTLRTPREVVAEWFETYPNLHHLSNREIAKRCGATEGTVRNYKKELYPEPAIEVESEPETETMEAPAQVQELEHASDEHVTSQSDPIEDITPESEPLPKIEPSEEVKQEREARRQQVQERNEQLKEKGVDLPTGKYSCIVVDPPWHMQKIEREERPNQFEFDYPTMTEEELKAFPLPDIAGEDCHMYLWTTQKHLPIALRLAEHWGFKYQCLMTWVKNVGFTPFSWMYSTEHVLFCTKGSLPLIVRGKRLDFSAKVREHSRKPDEFYDIVREVSPGPYLDVFSREKREGFEQYGNEVEKYV